MLPSYRRTDSAIFSRIGRWRKTLTPPRKPSSRPACCFCSVSGSWGRSRLGPSCGTRPWRRSGPWRGGGCWCWSRRWSGSYTWGWCWTSSHIQKRRADRPPCLKALEVAHAASLHEDNVAACRQAGSVYGCVDGHGSRIDRAVDLDARAASDGMRVNVIFCCAHVLAECVV
jgi:hypothetical protein